MPNDYGNFYNFCMDSTLPVCNLFSESPVRGGSGFGQPPACALTGIPLSRGRHLRNLGSIILDGIGILIALALILRSQRKRAAVGRREMQLFLLGYILIDICEIFSIGGFPLKNSVRIGFTGAHIGLITATTWILMINGAVGYQLIDDGTALSVGLTVVSAAVIFIGTGYIALDTGFSWTGFFNSTITNPDRSYALYTLYLLAPIVFMVIYFLLQTVLVLKILGETRPLIWLASSALLFAIGQVFDFVISTHICNGTNGKIDGALFETLFTLLAVIMVWMFWSSITEDDWPLVANSDNEQQYMPGNAMPANIPLHTLSTSSRPPTTRTTHESHTEKPRDRLPSHSSDSAESDFSLWSDTGDLVDQLADEEDPLRARHPDVQTSAGSFNRPIRSRGKKHVHYDLDDPSYADKEDRTGTIRRKEDIPIPDPVRKPISRGERFLVFLMAADDAPSRMHGLHGKKLIYFTSVFVSLGVFLFGYDQGVMSGIITGLYFRDYFGQPSRAEIGTMVAILEIGALIASLGVGKIGDIIGRRRTIFWGSIIFLFGGAFQTFATGMPMMLVGRIVAGLGVGTLSTIVPVYQSEISPPHNRGKLACIEFSGNVLGYAASVWVDYVCTYIKNDWAWRLPLLMQCVMGGLLAVGSLVILESPRWLLDNDHDEEGIVVIANLYGKGDIHNPKAREEYREIKMNVLLQRQEGERSYKDMFVRYGRRVFIAMSAQALAQLNGINVISYYAPLVFESAGWIGRDAILMTGINALTYLAATVPPWYLVDRWGRRFILLSGALAMIVSLSAISYFLYVDIYYTPTLVVVFVMLYNAAFGFSWGPIPWLYPPEILPLSIRAKGASLSTASNWAFNWVVGEMTPILQEWITWRLYLLHAFFCAVSFIVVWFIYPETANVRLEDMNALFGDATSTIGTPASLSHRSSNASLLGGGGDASPVPSLTLDGGGGGSAAADGAIPGLDIDPPHVQIKDGKPILSRRGSDASIASVVEGVGGWIGSLVKRGQREGADARSVRSGAAGSYRPVGQNEG